MNLVNSQSFFFEGHFLLAGKFSTKNRTDFDSKPTTLHCKHQRSPLFLHRLHNRGCQKFHPLSSGIQKPGEVPWWSEEIFRSIKARRKALRKYKLSKLQTDVIEYKKSRAKSRALILSSKKQSWSSYVSGINKPESLSTMWKDIKRLSGNSSLHTISQLKTNSQILSSSPDIAELLAKHFANTSSDNNYTIITS